jgi:hypothetical protein
LVSSIAKNVLRRMYIAGIIGGKHTAIESLKRGVPSHVRGDIDSEVKDLIKAGFILPKPTSYGLQISLNPRMIPEIERILEV